MEILRDLFDEKIISIINLFLDNPEKRFSLTDIAKLSKVNVATTFRILNKLIEKKFIKTIVIGKIRVYQLEKNEKTLALSKLLKKEETPLHEFIDKLKEFPRIKKIILDTKGKDNAKVIIVGNFLPVHKIEKITEEIKNQYNFKINFVEISENQYENLKNFQSFDLERKIIWQRGNEKI